MLVNPLDAVNRFSRDPNEIAHLGDLPRTLRVYSQVRAWDRETRADRLRVALLPAPGLAGGAQLQIKEVSSALFK